MGGSKNHDGYSCKKFADMSAEGSPLADQKNLRFALIAPFDQFMPGFGAEMRNVDDGGRIGRHDA